METLSTRQATMTGNPSPASSQTGRNAIWEHLRPSEVGAGPRENLVLHLQHSVLASHGDQREDAGVSAVASRVASLLDRLTPPRFAPTLMVFARKNEDS